MSTPEKVRSILNFYQQVVETKELPKDMAKIRELAAVLKEMNFENLGWIDAIRWRLATEQTKGIADRDEKIVRLVSEVFWDKRALAMHYLGLDSWSKGNPQRAAAAAKVIDFFIDPAKSENCLDLHGLVLTDADIPPCLQNLPDFKVVDLSGNCLTKIPEFPGRQKVETLNLNGNNIKEIPDNMEQRLPNLTSLKLDLNPLDVARIPVSIFKHSKLQQLKFFKSDFNANSLRTVAKILPGYDTCVRDLLELLSGMDELQKKYIFVAIEVNLPAKTHEVIKRMHGKAFTNPYNKALVAACLFHPNANVPLEKVEQLDEAFNKPKLSLFDFPLKGVAFKNAVERAMEFIPYIQERSNIDPIKDIIKTLFVEDYIHGFYDNPFIEHLSDEELRIIANKQILKRRDTWLNASRLSRESLLYYVQHFMAPVMYQIGHTLKDNNIDPQGAAELLFPILTQLDLGDINHLIDNRIAGDWKSFLAKIKRNVDPYKRALVYISELISRSIDIPLALEAKKLGVLEYKDKYIDHYKNKFELFKILKPQLQAIENLQDRIDLFSKAVDILPYMGKPPYSLEIFQRARELQPHIQLLNYGDKELFGAILHCLFKPKREDVSHFHHNFTKSIPFLLKLKPQEFVALLNVTDEDVDGKTVLQNLKNYQAAMDQHLLKRLNVHQKEKLIKGPYKYGLDLFHSAILNELPEKWSEFIEMHFDNNRIIPVKRAKFIETVQSLVGKFSDYEDFIIWTFLDKPESLMEIEMPEQGKDYERAISLYFQVYPKENREAIVNVLNNAPHFLIFLSQYPQDVGHRAIELLPYRNLVPKDARFYCDIIQLLFKPDAWNAKEFHNQFTVCIPFLLKLKPQELAALLNVTYEEIDGKTVLQNLKNYQAAMDQHLLDRLNHDQKEKLIKGPYKYGLDLFHSAILNELPGKWSEFIKMHFDNNRIVPDKRAKFIETVQSLVGKFSDYEDFIIWTILDKPESLMEIEIPEQGNDYERSISLYFELYPKENREAIVNVLNNDPRFLNILSQYPQDVGHRAIELLPYRNLVPKNARFYCDIIQLLFKPDARDAKKFHNQFTACIPFLLKLKAEELIALLNVTDRHGYSLRQDFHRIVPLIEQLPAEVAATLIPLGLTLEDFKRTKMSADWCFQVDKFDPKYSNEIASRAYLRRSQALSAKLLTLWNSLQFSRPNVNEQGKVPHLFLEVNGRFATPQKIRNALVEMFNKLQNKKDWLGVPNDPNGRELFYKEMLITFEEVAEALEKTEDVSLVAGTLISIATPVIEGRCGAAYIDELKQKAEYINPVSAPKDYKSRYRISANKALFAMITNLGVRFWESDVHALRHLKYVSRLGLSPDPSLLNDDTAIALIRDNFDLERFLKDIGHDFSDQMCDLYFEETMPNTYNPGLSNLQAKYKDEEAKLLRSFKIDPKLLEKLASMRTTLRHIPINRVTSASRANLIKVVEEDIRGILPDLEVVVKAELDAFKADTSRENLDNLNKAINEYTDARRRSYLKSRVLQLPDNEKMAIAHFKRSLEGIRSFELEMQPLRLKAKDLLEALKVRIALENGLMDLGKNLPDDITYSMQEHGTPSEAIRQERLLQYKIEKLGEDFNFYRKLLYIGKEEKILV